jgi:hypothetical protein
LKVQRGTNCTLHLTEPWIVYGRPTAAAVKELNEQRGQAKIKGERIPFS